MPFLRRLDNWTEGLLSHLNPFGGASHGAASPAAPMNAASSATGASGGGVHITVGPITLTGVGTDIRAMIERLFHEMSEKLGQSLSHGSSFTAGSGLSVFPNGAFP